MDRSQFFSYQHKIVEHIKKHDRCAIWAFMGAGKSCTTLTAFSDMRDSFDARRMLVIAPLRVARKVWRDEIQEWAHLQDLSISHIIGDTPDKRWAGLRTRADIHTVNIENVQWLQAQFVDGKNLLMRWPWDMVILDESSKFKSADAERWKALRRLLKLFPRLVELTGTPSPNGLHDLWAQYWLLDRGARLGQTLTAFRQRWFECVRQDGFNKWVQRDTADAEIHRAVADITLSLREEDYLDLPPIQTNTIRVELSPGLMAKYKRLEKEAILALANGGIITGANAGAIAGKLLQLANGAVYDAERNWHTFHEEKINALLETLDASARSQALIAYAYKHDLARISQALDRFCGKSRRWVVLRTDDSFARWAAGDYDYGVLHPASAGHGLNDIYKSGVEDLIWFGLTNNLEYYQQLNARLTGGNRRRGRNVVLTHIVCDGTSDAKLLPLLSKKNATQEDLRRAVAEIAKEAL